MVSDTDEDRELKKKTLVALQDIAAGIKELNRRFQHWDMTGLKIKKD